MKLNIDGAIGVDVFAREVREQLAAAEGPVEILVNSPGGSVTEGVAIYNAIRDYRRAGNQVTARVVGLAASMSSYIPLAADTVTVEDNAVFMIHEPSMIALGRKSDMGARCFDPRRRLPDPWLGPTPRRPERTSRRSAK
jgi:ATP-dependent protease ClpP protease subunit